jgi:hypothetical protein
VPTMHSMMGPGRRMLVRHLSRLSETLETFGSRLREAVSSAVGETVAGVVRETVRAVLDEESTAPIPSGRLAQPPYRSQPLWARQDDPDEEPWYDTDDYRPEGDYQDEPPAARPDPAPRPSRLPRAIAVGLTTTLRWLRRSAGRFPVVTAVAVGLLTGLATYAGGPLAAAAVALAGSAFNLLSLAEVVHAGADALATFGAS